MRVKGVAARSEAIGALSNYSWVERVVPTSVGLTALSAQLIAVGGQVAPVAITTVAATPTSAKDAYFFAVVDRDGSAVANPITISTPNGRLINGNATVVINGALKGLILFYSRDLDEWLAFEGLGAAGAPVPSPALDFANLFALMPGDNAGTVAVGAAVQFPQNGPAAPGSGITRLTASTFQLAAIGTYKIDWQVSFDEAGQLQLKLGAAALANTVVGRATGTNQAVGSTIITTSIINSVLSVINPAGNAAALTITPTAGGTHAVSATLTVTRLL
jgi:hypothetical protein